MDYFNIKLLLQLLHILYNNQKSGNWPMGVQYTPLQIYGNVSYISQLSSHDQTDVYFI